MSPPMKARDHNDARVFHQKEQSIRKPVNAGPAFPLIDNGVMQWPPGYAGDGVIDRRGEALRQLRPDGPIMCEGFTQFRVRFRKPNDR